MQPNQSINTPLWIPLASIAAGGFILVGGILALTVGENQLIGGILAIVLGLLALAGGTKMVLNRSFMTLTPEGIVPSTGGLIPWGDIRDMRESEVGFGRNKTRFVEIDLADRRRYDASQRLGPSAPLRWRVLTKDFAGEVVRRSRDYAMQLHR